MPEPLKASQGSLFVQTVPGEAPEYVGCVDVDALADSRGSISLIRCRDANGNFQTIGETQDAPDVVTTTITALVYPDADILDRIGKCRVNLFIMLRDCKKAGQFQNWVRADVLHHAKLTGLTSSNFAMREAGDPATRALAFAGWGVAHLRNRQRMVRLPIAETTSLNALAFDQNAICAGDCGETREVCEVGFLGGEAPSGSPTDRADIWQTDDSGSSWTNIAGAAGHPFVAGQDIKAAAVFDLDRSTQRWLVAREIIVGEPLKIAYSDNGGVAWTLVTVGSVNGEGAVGAKALYVLDRDHIWLATTEGAIYFSADGGISWGEQTGAVSASGGESLNAIQFLDADNGYAVGDNGAIIRTLDGGDTWEAISAPAGVTDDITALAVFSPFRIEIGTDADGLYQTRDSGSNWRAKTYAGQSTTGTIAALVPASDFVVYMLHNPLSGQGYVLRSIDGGHSWERMETPVNSGLRDIVVCDENNAFVVGAAHAGTGFVAKISG